MGRNHVIELGDFVLEEAVRRLSRWRRDGAPDLCLSVNVHERQLLDGDYPAAEASFRAFVDQYGDTARAAEARYYLGKTLLARRAYAEAASADIAAIRDWPQTAWAPDAVLDLSRALVGMRRLPDACSTLTELGRRYPRATTDVKNRAATLRTQAQCTAP